MNWRALDSPRLGKPFRYLEHYHITHRKVFRATWDWKVPQKLTKTQKFRESQLALKNKIWSFARFLKLSFTSLVRNVTIWCALNSPGLGQPFKYLGHHHITHRKFFKDTWSWKMHQKVTKTQKFRKSQLALKNKISSFARFLKLSFSSKFCDIMIWCALDSPGLGQHLKYLERYHITHRKFFRATWSWKMPQKLFFRASWDSRNFCVFISFWRTFWLQVALKIFLWVIWWRSRYSKGCPR